MKIEKIGPENAWKILGKNTINRPLTDPHVLELSHDMTSKKWRLIEDPICIAEDGTVLNGQFRLWAIIHSNTTQEFWVARGCDKENIKFIDGGLTRKFSDRMWIHSRADGKAIRFPSGSKDRHLAIVRGFYSLPKNPRLAWTIDNFREAYQKARPFVNFAEEIMVPGDKRRRLACAPCVIAVARANSCDVSKEVIGGFAKVFCEGSPSGIRPDRVDSYIRHLRDKFLEDPIGPNQKKLQIEYYLMTAKAIHNFDIGEAPQKIYKTDGDPYPLRKTFLSFVTSVQIEEVEESFREQQRRLLGDGE